MNKSYLSHHGIKGQKWGIRRYQNYDGTYTQLGKEHRYYLRRIERESKNVDDVNRIVATLSEEEQQWLGKGSNRQKWIEDDERFVETAKIAKTFIQRVKDIPVSMIEIWDDGLVDEGVGLVTIATDPRFRGTGVTSKNIQEALDWFESNRNKKIMELQWNNLKVNKKSGQIAERFGFGEPETDDEWEYRSRIKKSIQN